MPELAEVEYYRKLWNPGLRSPVLAVAGHFKKRVFRGVDIHLLQKALPGARLVASEARGKQMVFQFQRQLWLGLHLGMSGALRLESRDFRPGKHDHLVLYQKARALVFADPRQFGRVLFHQGDAPAWWKDSVPGVTSRQFTAGHVATVLARHRTLPIKAALLLQQGFPGIGNWMADEILWQARIHPQTLARDIQGSLLTTLRRCIRSVAGTAIKTIGHDFSDPPAKWLFHQRWKRAGHCPRDGTALSYATVGGRTTAWCPHCQPRS